MRWAVTVSMAVLVLAVAFPTGATTVLKLPVEDMTRRADLVMRAQVGSVDVRVEQGGVRPVATVVTFRVLAVLKGQATSPIFRLELPGGHVGTASSFIPGMPSFREGEEVVLFLQRTPGGFIPAGLSQGKYRVRRESSGLARAARETINVSRVAHDVTGKLVHVEGPDPEDDLPLDDLLKAVGRGLLRKGGAR
jgi:hypothetical protein